MEEKARSSSGFACAVVQTCSTEDLNANLEQACQLVRQAAADGADLVALPENFAWLAIKSSTAHPRMPLDGPVVVSMAALAHELQIHLLLGSISEESPDPNRTFNTSVWLGPDGEVKATYRKLFLFDIEIPGAESHRESERTRPGGKWVTVDTSLATFGLSICYDLRFPELYRHLADEGATCMCIPAAFTQTTGKDHWHVLLRARAIENQCFVIAPGQWGHHGGRRHSYGHSIIIDPWGHTLAEVPDGVGYAIAQIDLERLRTIREQLPALCHRRKDVG